MNAPVDFDGAGLAKALRDNAPDAHRVETHLHQVLADLMETPGKMVRAKMVYVAARSHGLSLEASEQLACGVEYFHTASLLLDDLPCMDDAETRRGRPCAHRVHGEATAILAALALINRAHVLIGLVYASYEPVVRLQATLCLDDFLGVDGLVGGQARDLRYGESLSGCREVCRIAEAKTGALFKMAIILPVIAGHPSRGELHLLKSLALYWGQWFQAVDDLKDVLATEVEAGKSTRRDRMLRRPNLAVALGVAGARRRTERLEHQIDRTLQRLLHQDDRWAYLGHFHATMAQQFRAQAA